MAAVGVLEWLLGPTCFGGMDHSGESVPHADATSDGEVGTVVVAGSRPATPAAAVDENETRSLPAFSESAARELASAPSAIAAAAMAEARRRLLWLARPVLNRAIMVLFVASRAEAQLQLFTTHPMWLLVIVRACRVAWAEVEGDAGSLHNAGPAGGNGGGEGDAAANSGDEDGGDHDSGESCELSMESPMWTPSVQSVALSMQQVAARALEVLQALAAVQQLRQQLLELGTLVSMLRTAAGGSSLLDELLEEEFPARSLAVCVHGTAHDATARRQSIAGTPLSTPHHDSQNPRRSFLVAHLDRDVDAAQRAAAAAAAAGARVPHVHGRPDEPDSWVEELAVRQAAARVLQYLVGAADEMSRLAEADNAASDLMTRAMRQLVTPGMVRRLKEGSFLRYALTETTEGPIVLWNQTMRYVCTCFDVVVPPLNCGLGVVPLQPPPRMVHDTRRTHHRKRQPCLHRTCHMNHALLPLQHTVTNGLSVVWLGGPQTNFRHAAGRVAMLNPPHFWRFGVFLRPETMITLYPNLEREVLLADVWVRLYVLLLLACGCVGL